MPYHNIDQRPSANSSALSIALEQDNTRRPEWLDLPYQDNDQYLSEKRSALSVGLKMENARRPDWLNESVAIHAALTIDEKNIGKVEHLERAQHARRVIHRWESYQRKRAKSSTAEVALRAAAWGLIELRVQPPRGKNKRSCQDPVLLIRPRAVAEEPLLLQDLIYQKEYWAIDIRMTAWLQWYIYPRYSGPGELNIGEGNSFLEAAAIEIVGLSDELDWQAAGEALGAIFDHRFDAGVAALIRKVRQVHQLARR